jgi:hypothetical protein
MSLLTLCTWLENTPLAIFVRESSWAFQTLIATHILGLIFSVGVIVWFDLRLLGVSMPRTPVSVVYRKLAPVAMTGFLVMFASGALLMTAYATSAYKNVPFRIKLIALALAGLNAGVYHLTTERRIAQWDEHVRLPLRARMAGLLSIGLWAVVILAGRLVSYTLYSR